MCQIGSRVESFDTYLSYHVRYIPRRVFPNKKVGGLGPDIKFGGKIWGKVRPSSPNKGKNFCHHKTQKLGKSPNFGVISEIQRVKFGVFATYIFGGKIWGSNKNFRGKFWGQAPRPPNLEVPPWGYISPLFWESCINLQLSFKIESDIT